MNYLRYTILFLVGFGTTFSWAQCNAEQTSTNITHDIQVVGSEVNLFLFSTYDAPLGDWYYSVDFGDGSPVSTGSSLATLNTYQSKTYATPGLYTITTTISFEESGHPDYCSYTHTNTITIENPVGNCSPMRMGAYVLNKCLGGEINFSLTSPPGISYEIAEVIWDLGNGTLIATDDASLDYVYPEPGVYHVKAKVTIIEAGGETCVRYAETGDDNLGRMFYFDHKIVRIFDSDPQFSITPLPVIPGTPVNFIYTGTPLLLGSYSNLWNYEFFINGSLVSSETWPLETGDLLYTTTLTEGAYEAKLKVQWKDGEEVCPQYTSTNFNASNTPCDTCNSFRPFVGGRYWMSAWVKVDEPTQVKSYNPLNKENGINLPEASLSDAYIEMEFFGSSTTAQFFPTGTIIDGWQRIVGEFTIPSGTYDLGVNLYADNEQDTFFDDIRIHPFNGSMKSYVYDGETFWLTSELDDNNYATFYEYDQEGGLVRIKKETARGIVTIQETRSSTIKK